VSLQELSRDTHPNPPKRDGRCRKRLTDQANRRQADTNCRRRSDDEEYPASGSHRERLMPHWNPSFVKGCTPRILSSRFATCTSCFTGWADPAKQPTVRTNLTHDAARLASGWAAKYMVKVGASINSTMQSLQWSWAGSCRLIGTALRSNQPSFTQSEY